MWLCMIMGNKERKVARTSFQGELEREECALRLKNENNLAYIKGPKMRALWKGRVMVDTGTAGEERES